MKMADNDPYEIFAHSIGLMIVALQILSYYTIYNEE